MPENLMVRYFDGTSSEVPFSREVFRNLFRSPRVRVISDASTGEVFLDARVNMSPVVADRALVLYGTK